MYMPSRLGHLIKKFCEICVYKLIVPYLSRPNIRNICNNLSQPVNDESELNAQRQDRMLVSKFALQSLSLQFESVSNELQDYKDEKG